jgi:hypothetical protein
MILEVNPAYYNFVSESHSRLQKGSMRCVLVYGYHMYVHGIWKAGNVRTNLHNLRLKGRSFFQPSKVSAVIGFMTLSYSTLDWNLSTINPALPSGPQLGWTFIKKSYLETHFSFRSVQGCIFTFCYARGLAIFCFKIIKVKINSNLIISCLPLGFLIWLYARVNP